MLVVPKAFRDGQAQRLRVVVTDEHQLPGFTLRLVCLDSFIKLTSYKPMFCMPGKDLWPFKFLGISILRTVK